MKKISLSLVALATITILSAEDLRTAVSEVLSTNPIILEQQKNYNSTKEDITVAKAGFYPKLDLSLGFGYEHTDLNNRPLGAIDQSFDFNVYDHSLKYTQNIFKGFETTYQIKEHKNRTIAAAYHYVEKVNSTAFEMVNQYILLLKQKELLENTQKNIDINSETLQKVQKLYDSGLTTLSEVNKIESSLALAKSNFIVQENNLEDATNDLHKTFGRYIDVDSMVEPTSDFILPDTLDDAEQFALLNNPSLLVQKYNIKLAQATYHKNKSPFYPAVDIEVSQSLTENLGASEGDRNRFRAMAYLTYNIFNGFADEATLQKSISEVHKEVQLKDRYRRETIDDLALSWSANKQLTKQLVLLNRYKDFSEKTLNLYQKEYDLGNRSLLDLLSAQNDYINSDSQIITSKYSLLFAKYRILDSLGTLVTTIMGSNNVNYSNVGLTENNDVNYSHLGFNGKKPADYDVPTMTLDLNKTAPKNSDTLPILEDRDTDLIVDDMDRCNNSLNYKLRDTFGCKHIFEDTVTIERYRGLLFEGDNATITPEAQKRLNAIVKQVKPYGFEYLRFELFGHVDNEDMSKVDMRTLSRQRAEAVRKQLINAGAKQDKVIVHALSDEAPLYTNGLYENEGEKLNNRVDIAVRKLIKDRDSDKDGVFDSKDKCPTTPLGRVVDTDGCQLDSDGDGVVDFADKCPVTPLGREVDIDGCQLDSDSDGVLDFADKCPNTPLGREVDVDGCEIESPEVNNDSDGDGVTNFADQCPNTPKEFRVNSVGCPQTATLKVNFEFNRYDIKQNSKNEIKKYARFLNDNPKYDAIILGHTDSIGGYGQNQILSQHRANSVKNALINEGVDADRLSAIGKGEREPIATNMYKAGRAKNRRIEIELTKQI